MSKFVIKAEKCRIFIEQVLTELGASSAMASKWGQLIVETSLLGFDSHGIRMLERYIAHIEGGGIDLSAEPEIVKQHNGCVHIDAKGLVILPPIKQHR